MGGEPMEDGTSIPKNPVGSRLPREIREEKKLIKKGGDCNRKGGLRNIKSCQKNVLLFP